eukprot:TRINITY_DN6587_c0_g2_i1.p1 TRINITY_DN6587_c0_g2~~TRINITY_DN6587_c0_g2_i1.p1  ORF type:complete len:436 (+),score=68.59 TRINITY_DN6587_c0_g2_i1:154-1461(+)
MNALVGALWLGQTLSLIADDIEQFALKTTVHGMGHNLTDLTLFVISVELPSLLLSPFIGALVDRLPKTTTIIAADTLSVASTVVLAFELNVFGFLTPSDAASSLQPDHPRWGVIYTSCAINSIANVLQWPAFQVLMRRLVDGKHVSMYTQSAPALSMLLAPLVSSYILQWFGLSAVFGLSVVTWALAVAIMAASFFHNEKQRAVAASPSPGQVWKDAMEVISVVSQSQAMRASAALMISGYLAVGMVQLLMMPLVLSTSSPQTLGWILTLSGCGSIAGLGLPRVMPLATHAGEVLINLTLFQAGMLVVCGLFPQPLLLLAFAFLYMVVIPTVRSCRTALVNQHIPKHMVGRALAMQKGLMQACVPLAAAFCGPLHDAIAQYKGQWGKFLPGHPAPATGVMFCVGACMLALTGLSQRYAMLRIEREQRATAKAKSD